VLVAGHTLDIPKTIYYFRIANTGQVRALELDPIPEGFLLAAGFGTSQIAALYIVKHIFSFKIRLEDPSDTSQLASVLWTRESCSVTVPKKNCKENTETGTFEARDVHYGGSAQRIQRAQAYDRHHDEESTKGKDNFCLVSYTSTWI
jgi:hypothetical protein